MRQKEPALQMCYTKIKANIFSAGFSPHPVCLFLSFLFFFSAAVSYSKKETTKCELVSVAEQLKLCETFSKRGNWNPIFLTWCCLS